jgi:hypothetical protein
LDEIRSAQEMSLATINAADPVTHVGLAAKFHIRISVIDRPMAVTLRYHQVAAAAESVCRHR